MSKINTFNNGRQGISVQYGIDSYKMLMRPHLEYAWTSISENDLVMLEDVQVQCMKRVYLCSSLCSSSTQST